MEEIYPSLKVLQENWPAIREELEEVLPLQNEIPRYHDLDKIQYTISGKYHQEKSWKVFLFEILGYKVEKNRIQCPKTAALLDQIPDKFQAFFSILDPGKSIPAHDGPYRGYLRYHLGLITPQENPPSIRIKDQIYTWEEGKDVFFDDSWNHEVMNNSSEKRVILIVDVLRPMPWLPDKVNRFMCFVTKYLYGRSIYKRAMR